MKKWAKMSFEKLLKIYFPKIFGKVFLRTDGAGDGLVQEAKNPRNEDD